MEDQKEQETGRQLLQGNLHMMSYIYPSTEKKELGEENVINVGELQESRKELVEAQNDPEGEE